MLAVTGITGHTGRCFINELVKNRYAGQLRCLVHTAGKTRCITESGLNAEVVEGTLDDEADIRTLLSGADTVLHIANIHYSPEIVRIGKECGVKRFILVHTTGIFSKYKSASESYIEVENIIIPLMEELNITILRPTMIFGDICDYNISKFIKLLDRLPIVPVISGGRSLIQPVNARDLARAFYQVLNTEQCKGKAYNLSGERAVSIRQLYNLICRGLGKRCLIVSFPMWVCVFAAKVLRAVTFGKLDLVEKVQRMGENRSYSHAPATADFGYSPEPFEVGLKREIAEYIAAKR